MLLLYRYMYIVCAIISIIITKCMPAMMAKQMSVCLHVCLFAQKMQNWIAEIDVTDIWLGRLTLSSLF